MPLVKREGEFRWTEVENELMRKYKEALHTPGKFSLL